MCEALGSLLSQQNQRVSNAALANAASDQFLRAIFSGNSFFFLWGDPLQNPRRTPAPEHCISSRKRRSFEVPERGGIQEGRGRWGGGKKKEKGTRKKCSGFSVLNLKFDFISDGGRTRDKQIQKALGSLPPCGNRCRFSESAICSSRVRPPSEIKSNFKFKTLRWRPLRWRLTLSDKMALQKCTVNFSARILG